MIQTQCIEDAFNRQKNCHHLANRRGNCQEMFRAVLHRKVGEEVHHFTPVDQSQEEHQRGAALLEDVFQAQVRQLPADVQGMSSFSQKTEWYTSTAYGYSKVYTNLPMMEFIVQHNLFDKVKNLWLGRAFAFQHHFVCRHNCSASDNEWMFPIKWVEGSACLCWPADRHDCIEGGTFFVPRTHGVSLAKCFVPRVDLD